ncbi:hypothetical protein CEXT_811641 [Caerostris extrusa]|uniref:Secreted protein n=1 Tax=Caerostris extrusa TaxID=172846 RepID=A0AAV4WUN3_CAEEX|nr:hypothetical protein CEXT_811641 [Caerostris extrusa]
MPLLVTALCVTTVDLNHCAEGNEKVGGTERVVKDWCTNNKTPLRFPVMLRIRLPWSVKKHGTEAEQRILTGMDKSGTLRQSRIRSIENSFLVEKSKHGDLLKR